MATQILTNEQLRNNLEIVLDKIATAMMLQIDKFSNEPTDTLYKTQKTISRGIVTTVTDGLTIDDILVLYQKDTLANPKDAITFQKSLSHDPGANSVYGPYNIIGLTAQIDSWGDIDVSTISTSIIVADFATKNMVSIFTNIVKYENILIFL